MYLVWFAWNQCNNAYLQSVIAEVSLQSHTFCFFCLYAFFFRLYSLCYSPSYYFSISFFHVFVVFGEPGSCLLLPIISGFLIFMATSWNDNNCRYRQNFLIQRCAMKAWSNPTLVGGPKLCSFQQKEIMCFTFSDLHGYLSERDVNLLELKRMCC